VEQVSWFDSVRFCNALSEKLGLRQAYRIGNGDAPVVTRDFASPGFRLPTEAEWECAARAGTTFRYAGGDDIGAVAWFQNNSTGTTHPVAQKKANAWGLYDMSGHVFEWTSDWYNEDPTGNSTDPMGAAAGEGRVVRGGSWNFDADDARVAGRWYSDPQFPLSNFQSLRVARSVP
jgi:formylglycine-generating enzyme required for sulfatase activity